MLLNTVIFFLITRDAAVVTDSLSSALFHHQLRLSLSYGAKEPVLLVAGQWWRLFCPMFVHIGLMHFAFNNFFLLMVGPQMKGCLVGKGSCRLLVTGITGNLLQCHF